MNCKVMLFIVFPTMLITACEHKEILAGKREEFLDKTASTLAIDKSIANLDVVIPPASSLSNYTEISGNPTRNLINCSLGANPQIAWKTKSSIVGGPGIVCFKNKLYAVGINGELSCISAKSGKILWTKKVLQLGYGVKVSGSATILDNKTIVIATNTGNVIGVDIDSRKEVFRHDIKLPIKSSPAVAADKIVITTINNKTMAICGQKVLWEQIGKEEETIIKGGRCSPAVYSGNTAICAYTSGDISAIQINDGREIWSDILFSGNTYDSGFTISHIVASPVIHGEAVLVANAESKIALIDINSGVRIWDQNIGTVNTPVIAGDWIFVLGSSDNILYCLSVAGGAIKWKIPIAKSKSRLFGPMLINGEVALFSETGEMSIYNPKNGNLIRTIKLGTTIANDPIIVNNSMYVSSNSGEIVCLK